ncbi:hypothetical protein [Blastomonas sp.]|uniref:hypothetical protein n=1 Tax=Blastomonas sp. TaxID=1909299 RepID=UPI0026138B20|nr:hypothetical protein [Blastomonas sp.]MDM7955499.1 hypothetical protein [Blastomonas sp.]
MKAAFTCSYGLVGRRLTMEMSFPHDMPVPASSTAISLRRLDMDILRVLAFSPVMALRRARFAGSAIQGGDHTLMALFAGTGRADHVAMGSFNPHFAVALDQLSVAEQQDETGVYHSASVNRKAARLLRSNAPIETNQAF